MNKVDQDLFLQQVSTFRSGKRENVKQLVQNIESNVNVANELLRNKEIYPDTFREISQCYLDALKVGLDAKCLFQPLEEKRSRKMYDILTPRKRSRTRERSMSPSGARKARPEKWKKNAELASSLVDYLMEKQKEWPENLFISSDINKDSKIFLNDLIVSPISMLKETLKHVDLVVVGECLILLLNKLGVLLPAHICEQFLKLKEIIRNTSHGPVIITNKLSAAQILLLNIPNHSRLLLEKVVSLFNTITGQEGMKTNLMDLAEILSHSLFEGESTFMKLKLATDFVMSASRIMNCPKQLLLLFKEKLNNQPINISHFFENPEKNLFSKQPQKSENSTPTVGIQQYFVHTKGIRESKPTDEKSKKRCSFVDLTKKICKKTLSPFKTKSSGNKD